MVSFSMEVNKFAKPKVRDLKFVSSFIQHMNHVLLNTKEAKSLRVALLDCIAEKGETERDHQRSRLFHILLHSWSHNIAATISLCLWAGAYRTASLLLEKIDPLDVNLTTLLEIDRLIEMLERPLFRHLHVRMLEDNDRTDEGSGFMLFKLLKSLLMILPQSTCYRILRDRLTSVARFRQTVPIVKRVDAGDTESFVNRILTVRHLHCRVTWEAIRADSSMPVSSTVSVGDVSVDTGEIPEEEEPEDSWKQFWAKS